MQLYDVSDVYNRMWASERTVRTPVLLLRVGPHGHKNKIQLDWHEAHPAGAEGLRANAQETIKPLAQSALRTQTGLLLLDNTNKIKPALNGTSR